MVASSNRAAILRPSPLRCEAHPPKLGPHQDRDHARISLLLFWWTRFWEATAIPTMPIVIMFALQYHIAEAETASAVFLSVIGSVITMGIFIALTS
jgi:hypothetical protein